jgi:uncharacterized membrane protein YkvI
MDGANLRDYLTDAIKYWEPRRILYNLVLAAIFLFHYVRALPGSKGLISLNSVLFLIVLAVLANVVYCAAYLVDIFAQASGLRENWRRDRWILFTIGLIFAAILTRFWALGIFSQ